VAVEIGIVLPTGLDLARTAAWARSAEAHGFASLAVLDGPRRDPLAALAAAASATRRLGLLAPDLRLAGRDAAELAAQAAALDLRAAGRLTLGVSAGPGLAEDRAFGAQLGRLRERFTGRLLVAGAQRRAVERAARLGDGWAIVGGTAHDVAAGAAALAEAWRWNDRAGRPRVVAVTAAQAGLPCRLKGYADRGVTQLLVIPPDTDTDAGAVARLAEAELG